jgi:hypothetical protein
VSDPSRRLNTAELSRLRKNSHLTVSQLATRLQRQGWDVSSGQILRWEMKGSSDAVPALVEAIAAGPKDNLDSRTVVADWIRRNVEQLQVYPDGLDGPPGAVEKMRETMDPDIIAILDKSIAFAKKRHAIVDGSNRRFEVSFGGHKFRAVEVDRSDPTKLIVASYADENDWGVEHGSQPTLGELVL